MKRQLSLFKFSHPNKKRLEDLQMIRADLHRAAISISILIGPPPLHQHSPLFASALQVQALVSYVRCFATGRRSALNRSVFATSPAMEKLHDEFKTMRDQHVAHPAGPHEHNELILAAASAESAAKAIGSYNFFFAGFPAQDLRRFLKLIRFVDEQAKREETTLGDQLAKDIIGPNSTYSRAKRSFVRHIHPEQVYPTRRRASGA